MPVDRDWDKERVDRFLKKVILDLYFGFVWPNRTRNYPEWEAGMLVMNSIPTK